MVRLALLPVVLLFLLPGLTYAQVLLSLDAGVLKDVGSIDVIVEYLPDDFESFGLHGSDIQRDVELKLRLAGITIDDDESGYLYVNVSGVCPSDAGACGVTIEVLYREPVLVMRGNKNIKVMDATTWFALQSVGMVGDSKLQSIRDIVKDRVDVFINAYLTANPKR